MIDLNIEQMKSYLKEKDDFISRITYWKEIESKDAKYVDLPKELDHRLKNILKEKNIDKLYNHQKIAYDKVSKGENTVVVTPTASGKTLCYNLPVLNEILQNEGSRALYMFPTKALSQDQLSGLYELILALDQNIKTYTYDGDTQVSARKSIRQSGDIVITNPDMLHVGILPHHTKWIKLFENLKYIIIDEVHSYRGVFGSHVANVIRRLKRICTFYGSDPIFICASATIDNPGELSSKLIGEEVTVVDQNGAPSGPKDFIFYNPPVVNKELGIRRSYVLESKKIADIFLKNKIKTIIFTRSRLKTEIILSYLRENKLKDLEIRGYRGGYLPNERRDIEKGLRDGTIDGVVSTNALELGVDIGQLDASILAGYPGTIASSWQQAGRAGRGMKRSISILVASSNALDQYIVNNPEFFFNQPAENALINPNNLMILVSHIKCAAFELPFKDGEQFGVETTDQILSYLEDKGILRYKSGKWYWSAERYPAEDISLRSASSDDFSVIDQTNKNNIRVIGRVDYFSVPTTIHKDAIYIHEGRQYQVKELDYDGKKAYVKKADVNFYTDANLAVDLRVLDLFDKKEENVKSFEYGEVVVTAQATMYKKVKFNTHENVGYGDINLPEVEMHTTAWWLSLEKNFEKEMSKKVLENALLGLSNLLVNIAPIYLMCDPRDINSTIQIRSPFTGKPTVFIYDNYPGGVGLSEKIFRVDLKILNSALTYLKKCPCDGGCPACVGPINEVGLKAKEMTLYLLKEVLKGEPEG
ncbi:MAG: DEAD/DEAH box helicase [Halanaerobiales bacterium]|nr:DEAD/DEAH box helicase [Halanaerobiales bacterium]